jgi:N-acetylneuraminate lyase
MILKDGGLIAAPFTPMGKEGTINYSEIERYANYLKENGIKAVFICGTTGEGMLLSEDERKKLCEEWIKQRSEEFKVVVHVGSTSITTSSLLASHAESVGADAISNMGPMLFPPTDVEDLVKFCEPVAKAAGDTPYFYYHMPSISNVNVYMPDFIKMAKQRIKNFAGIKFTHNNMMEMQQSINSCDKNLEIMHGCDEILYSGLSLGIKTAVGSTYNYFAKNYHQLINSFNNRDLNKAREFQLKSIKLVEILIKYGGGVRAGKEIMKHVGIDCGSCRAPIPQFSNEETLAMEKDLKTINFI